MGRLSGGSPPVEPPTIRMTRATRSIAATSGPTKMGRSAARAAPFVVHSAATRQRTSFAPASEWYVWAMTHSTTGPVHLLALTGAGISVESGLSTYRAMNGLWRNHAVKDVATPYGFAQDPVTSWSFWSERRAEAQRAVPNQGHVALATLEQLLGDRFLLVTQNVDGLHQRAGNQRVVELHGNLHESRCDKCERPRFADDRIYQGSAPKCEQCSDGLLRPAVVWFGEAIQQKDMDVVERFMARAAKHRFIFMAIGTSGIVTPASAFVEEARKLGAESWLVNLDPARNEAYFDRVLLGESGTILPQLLAEKRAQFMSP